jgi:uncharacterized hydrophobic protein (TIGR00271 family)
MTDALTVDLRDRAHSDAAVSVNYIVLVVASCLISTLGLLENSVAVIIGAMIIAPLIGPIQSFAYAGLEGDARLLRKSLVAAAIGVLLAIGISWLVAVIVAFPTYGSEVAARTRPNVLDLAIAIAAGGVAGYARVRPSIASTVAGTAIAVALMPPLCVVGLLLGARVWNEAIGAALLFGTNFLGIAIACMIVYQITGRFERHGRYALIVTAVVVAALMFPLVASFLEITRESRIEAEIRNELIANTLTFKRTRLLGATFDWYADPLQARLDVSSGSAISTSQVRDLETFLARRIGRPIALVLDVSRYEIVRDTAAPTSAAEAAR